MSKDIHQNIYLSSAEMSTPIPPGGEILDFNKCPKVFSINFKVQHPVSMYLKKKKNYTNVVLHILWEK